MNKLILFDIDGTILKFREGLSKKIFSEIIDNVLKSKILWSNLPDFAGKTDLQILREICVLNNINLSNPDREIPLIWAEISKEFKFYCTKDYLKLMPGIVELLNLLNERAGVQLGLLTGNIRNNAYIKLDAWELSHFFPFGAFGDDNEDRNKLPEIAVFRANEFLNQGKFSVENSVIVGDSPRDIECAHVNGMPVVAVATGYSTSEELSSGFPEILLEDFSDYNTVAELMTETIYNKANG